MNYWKVKGGAKRFKWIVSIFIVLIVSWYALTSGFINIPTASILPGFQGVQDGIYGYQVQASSKTVPLGQVLPSATGSCGYSWVGSPTIGSATVQVLTGRGQQTFLCSLPVSDSVVLDAQTNPILSQNPYVVGQKVSYYVKNPSDSTKYMIVQGQVNIYTFNVAASIQSGSSGQWNFGGDTIWYNLYSQTWNQATSLPSNSSISGNAFEAPLYGVITNIQWQNQGSNGLSLSVGGATLSFYSSPSTIGQTLATLAGQQFNPSVNVNASLSSIYAPDSRLQRLVYYPISLQSFKANPSLGSDCTFGCTYPSVSLTITLYTLKIGEYILTNPSSTTLGNRNQGCTGLGCVGQFFNGLGAFFNSPLGFLTALFGTGVAIFVILAVFATPVIVALIWVFFGRKKERL